MIIREQHIDSRAAYPAEHEAAISTSAFEVLQSRYQAQPKSGVGHYAGHRSAAITVTRSTLVGSQIGSNPQQLGNAWPKTRSNRWVFDLFEHERFMTGDRVLVPAQTVFGSISGMTLPNDDLPEGELDLTPSEVPVRTAGVWTNITEETVEDYVGFSAWMNSEVTRQILAEIDNQLLNGSGTAPALQGVLNTSGIQTQSKGADTLTVAISKAFGKVLDAGYAPSAIIVSPDDFAALTAPAPLEFNGMMFNVPLIASSAVADNLPIIGDFLTATIFEREAIRFEMTNSNDDNFLMNLVTVRATQRLALAVFAPKAFCAVVA